MNLHEIIHCYLAMPEKRGLAWLQELVQFAGLDKALLPHIIATGKKEVSEPSQP